MKWQVVNQHGNVAKTATTGTSTPDGDTLDADPFGVAPATGSARCGWLAGKQPSGEALAGVILRGVRLYAPPLGRFLSVDPVPGVATTPTTTLVDPLNTYDFYGRRKSGARARAKPRGGSRKTGGPLPLRRMGRHWGMRVHCWRGMGCVGSSFYRHRNVE